MNNSWRFFIVMELLLLIFAFWQLIHNIPLFILLVLSGLNVLRIMRKTRPKSNFMHFQLVLSGFIIFICLVSTPALWIMLIFAILFIGLKGVEVSGIDITRHAFWRKKQMQIIQTGDQECHNGEVYKNIWFGNQRIGNKIYEWDDININLISGDTIIDLGNTLLPKTSNTIIIRKGLGRTRVLVPSGIGIMLEHSTFFGTVTFDEQRVSLKNERIKLYSENYDEEPRRLKIMSNSLVGDIEVIRV